MSDKNDKNRNPEGGEARPPQVGALLRASRLRVGEELRDIADALCIRYLYLDAIEACRYSDLPGDTYAIGFIRSYAEHLGLDGEEVVRRYRAEQAGSKRANELSFPTPVQESGMPKGAIVFVGVFLALLVYGGWYVSTTDETLLSDLISPVPDHLKQMVGSDEQTPPRIDAAPAQAPATPDTTPADSAAEMAAAAAEATEQAADAARDAAQEAERVVTDAASPAADAPAPTDTPAAAAATPAAPAETPAPASTTTPAPKPAAAVPPAETAAVTPSTPVAPVAPKPTETPAPAATASTVQPTAPKPAATQTPSATATAPTAQPATETPPAAETPSAADSAAPEIETATPLPSPSDLPSTGTETETAQTPPSTSELTAEELNALSLRVATGGRVTPPPVPGASAPAKPAAETAALPSSGVVVNAVDSSWVEIRNPQTGKVIFTGLMSPGASVDVPAINGLVLDTGNAGALDITVDGVSAPKIGGVGTVRKGVTLDGARLLAGTAATQ